MDNNRVKDILAILGVAVLCALCFVIGRWGRSTLPEPEIKWDTVTIEKPVPYNVKVTEYVKVPVPVEIPADTVYNTKVDSVLIQVPVNIETREYRDSSYRAIISGPAIGDFRPTLDQIDIYAKTKTITIDKGVSTIRPYVSVSGGKNILGVGLGVNIKGKALIGAKYMRIGNNDAVVGEVSWTF